MTDCDKYRFRARKCASRNAMPMLLAVFVLIAATFGCSEKFNKSAPTAERSPKHEGSSSELSAYKGADSDSISSPPVTEEEALAVGHAVEDAIARGDIDAFTSQFNWHDFATRTAEGMPIGASDGRPLREVMYERAAKMGPQLAAKMIAEMGPNGSFKLLRVITRDDGKRLLLRMSRPDTGLNYMEICLARDATGVRGVDIYTWSAGERISELLQRIIAGLISGSAGASSSPNRIDVSQVSAQVRELSAAAVSGDIDRASEVYSSLPESLQHHKTVLMLRILAGLRAGDADGNAIDEYGERFPDDPFYRVAKVHSHIARDELDEALKAIDDVDQAVGGDPYLDLWRGKIWIAQGRLDDAERVAGEQIRLDRLNVAAWFLLVAVQLERGDFKKTAELLTTMRDELGVEFDDLTTKPEYSDFVESPEFATWIKRE